MRAALVEELGGVDDVQLAERSDPTPGVGQVLIRVHGAGVGPWDVGFISGFAEQLGVPPPYVPGWEVAGVVETVGDGADVQPGDQVYASLFPGGGGYAELAVASGDGLARMPERLSLEEAAALVVAGGTAYEALVDRAQLQTGQTVLITAAAGGVGSLAVQIAAAVGARPLGVASARNHDYLRGLGASSVFDYTAPDWVEQVRAEVPGGVDLLLDLAGRQTRDQALATVRDNGRVIFLTAPFELPPLERGITGESFGADVNRQRLEAIGRLVDEGKLHAQLEAVLPLEQVHEALRRVAGGHTRGKIVLRIGE